jgi:FlgD Ig-like domain
MPSHHQRPALLWRAGLSVLFLLLAPCATPLAHAGEQLVLGAEPIVQGEFYVVHSGLARDGTVVNTSNIYVVRGAQDSVWLFGSGYGDRSHLGRTSDVQSYRPLRDAWRMAYFDAIRVDSIITNVFGLDRASATLTFIVPHFHFDHVNREFVTAFGERLGYGVGVSRVVVHASDSVGTTCNLPCCGNTPCAGISEFFGSPFMEPWSPGDLTLFDAVGTAADTCNQQVFGFGSPLGDWVVRKGMSVAEGGHTNGTVNLECTALSMRVLGANVGILCPMAPGWRVLGIHGNIDVATPVGSGGVVATVGPIDEECVALESTAPNPFAEVISLSYRLPREAGVLITIHDASGRRVRTIAESRQPAGAWTAVWDGRDDSGRALSAGSYFYRLAAGAASVTGKMILVR